MRKRIYWSLLLLPLLLLVPSPVLAESVNWEIIQQDDGTIQETVQVTGAKLSVDEKVWTITAPGNDRLVLSRNTANWAAYNQLDDRLPIHIAARNFLVMQVVRFYSEDYQTSSPGLYNQLAGLPEAQLKIQVPGIVREHSANYVEDSQRAVWNLNRLDHIKSEEFLFKAVIFNGFLLAVIMVAGAVLIIGLVFLRSIRRVDQLIEEEYSLENIKPDLIGDDSPE